MTTRESHEAVTPESIDVMCGSGQEVLEHPGTTRFRAIVFQHYRTTYSLAKTKTEKMKASKLIFDEIVQAGSRFLKKEPIYAYWYDAKSDKVGRDKISHLLRRIEKENKGDGRSYQRSKSSQQPSLPPDSSLSTSHGKSCKGAASHCGNHVDDMLRSWQQAPSSTVTSPPTLSLLDPCTRCSGCATGVYKKIRQQIQGLPLQKSARLSQSPNILPAQHRNGFCVWPEKQMSSSQPYGMMMTPSITLSSSYSPALVGGELNNYNDSESNTAAIVGIAATRRRSSTHHDIELERIIDVLSRTPWDQATEDWDATPLDKKRGNFQGDDYEPIATFQ